MVNTKQRVPQKYFVVHDEIILTKFFGLREMVFMATYLDLNDTEEQVFSKLTKLPSSFYIATPVGIGANIHSSYALSLSLSMAQAVHDIVLENSA